MDSSLVVQLAKAKAEGYNLWQQAKLTNDFNCFSPALKKLIGLRQEEANQLSEDRSCWETLAQPFEPDLSVKRLNQLFTPLREKLPELLKELVTLKTDKKSEWDLDIPSQEILCEQLLDNWKRKVRYSFHSQS